MRTISAAGLAKLAQRHGNEPITIVEVDWMDGSEPRFYADRDVAGIPGRIVQVGDLDNVVNISQNSNSQSLDIVLDDTDGTIKDIFDQHDIHKRTARVWQYFAGLDLSDKFLLFAGKISTPITWSERDRTVGFTIVSQLEDKEVGFSAEEGQFPYLPASLVGKPWPVIFGKCLDVPALQVNTAVQGTTLTGVGCLAGEQWHLGLPLYSSGINVDAGLLISLAQISAQISVLWCGWDCWQRVRSSSRSAAIEDQINALEKQRAEAVGSAWRQQQCAQWSRRQQLENAKSRGLGANPLKVLGGEDFPQDRTVTIVINGCLFTGYFHGQDFFIQSRYWPDGEAKAEEEAASRADPCPYDTSSGDGSADYDFRIDVPCGCGDSGRSACECRQHGHIISTVVPRGTELNDDPIMQQFWADAGAIVRLYSDEPITYIVSITPGTVLAVKAYKQFDGVRRLVDVPSEHYRVEVKDYGAVTAVQLVFHKPLSSLVDQGWSDDVYVTFEATAPTYGPNIADILIHLITTYTDLGYDAASFATVKTKLGAFPANFPILDRRSTLTVLQEIAYQARCALWLSNGTFYIRYLPDEPAADESITVSDVDAENSVEVGCTPTEDLVTKMKITWRISWAPGATDREKDKSEKWMILRHNVARYGTREEEYDWYIYNQPDSILKCATFWLIRKSQTWKTLRLKTFLHKLNLETFDCVTLDFSTGYVAAGAVKALVQRANYVPDENLVDLECLVPVPVGSMVKSPFFWPNSMSVDDTWPPQADIDTGNAGGGGIGMGATGELPVGYTDGIESGGTVFVGGPNVVFRSRSDWGDRRPTDVGFTPQIVVNTSVYGELSASSRPSLDLRPKLLRASNPLQLQPIKGGISIDIATTVFVDSRDTASKQAYMTSMVHSISENGELLLKPGVKLGDNEHVAGVPLTTLVYLTESKVSVNEGAYVASEAHAEGAPLKDALGIGESGSLGLQADVVIVNGDGEEASFDFEYDGETGVYGAGTAFLQD